MDGDSSGPPDAVPVPSPYRFSATEQQQQQHQQQHQQQQHQHPEAGSEPPSAATAHGRPRKFVIQSTFGVPRERRSRKSRPCDACRRRKTACIITTEPPCAFCRTRGITCQSTAAGEAALARTYAGYDHVAPAGSGAGRDHAETRTSPNTAKSSPCGAGGGLSSSPVPVAATGSTSAAAAAAAVAAAAAANSQYASSSRYGGHETPFAAYSSHGFESGSFDGFVRDADIKIEPDSSVMSMDIVQPALNSPESSVGSTASYTLEDNPGRSTYFLGSTAEQDPFVLDAFSYGILSEMSTVDANVVQIHRGGTDLDDLPQHFLFLSLGHPKHTNMSREEASDAIETKVWPHADVLVRLYFRHVHPILPLLSKVRFLRRYASNRKSIPACLRGAIYALASVYWTEDPSIRTADAFPLHQHEIVDQAHRALRREIENPNLFVVQACLLLIHVQPPSIDAMEAPSTFTLAAQATACAQLIGLHQDPSEWNLEPVEKKLRKKLWWSVFLTDCWAAISLGNPPHISETSFSTVPVDIEDLRCDEDVPDDLRYIVDLQNAYFDVASGARFLEYVKVSRCLRTVLDCGFQVNPRMSDPYDRIAARERLADIHNKLKDWPNMIPSCLVVPKNRDPMVSCYNCPLHLSFYATKVLLYRALMHPATKAAKSQPDSNLRQWFAFALADFAQFTEFFASVNPGDFRGFWGRHARSQLILCGNFLVYLFLMAADRAHIESAHKMLEDFRVKVNRIAMTDHVPTKAMIRATTIRTNSFFAQAVSVMRHGPEASITEPITVCGTDGPVPS
ncbi:hypothetical protein E4U13_008310 [Claviceps humidiphila]|uniref:Zn(2)-C6 fungal-type domain-containing protein n=1 Tax=Claviceps humidiphila TaxID=1294629 RepID=A0A9P7TPW6_9HYPO|nr:hypothetical protein E4U13_008310 [Claviceps humidiphila]